MTLVIDELCDCRKQHGTCCVIFFLVFLFLLARIDIFAAVNNLLQSTT